MAMAHGPIGSGLGLPPGPGRVQRAHRPAPPGPSPSRPAGGLWSCRGQPGAEKAADRLQPAAGVGVPATWAPRGPTRPRKPAGAAVPSLHHGPTDRGGKAGQGARAGRASGRVDYAVANGAAVRTHSTEGLAWLDLRHGGEGVAA